MKNAPFPYMSFNLIQDYETSIINYYLRPLFYNKMIWEKATKKPGKGKFQ
jgi:hypothetical protein